MTDFTGQTPQRRVPRWMRQQPPPRPADLDILRTHPSLVSLADKGVLLDRLPYRSTACTFAGALAVSVAAFGMTSSLVIVMIAVLAVLFTMSAMYLKDVAAARGVLTFARICLLAWVIARAGVLWFG